MLINLAVANQNLTIPSKIKTAQLSQKYIECAFDFQTEDWNDTAKTAVFKAQTSDNMYDVVLDENNTCQIPWEALTEVGTVECSVYGTKDGTVRITTNKVKVLSQKETLYGGSATEEPTPSVYEQLVQRVESTEEKIGEYRDESVAARNEAQGFAAEVAQTIDGAQDMINEAVERAEAASNRANESTEAANEAASKAEEIAVRIEDADVYTKQETDNLLKAENVSYDNTTSGLEAETAQAVMDELSVKQNKISGMVDEHEAILFGTKAGAVSETKEFIYALTTTDTKTMSVSIQGDGYEFWAAKYTVVRYGGVTGDDGVTEFEETTLPFPVFAGSSSMSSTRASISLDANFTKYASYVEDLKNAGYDTIKFVVTLSANRADMVHKLGTQVAELEETIGDIDSILDTINGEVV